MSGLTVGRSTALNSGSSVLTTASSAVPNGTTPSRISASISCARMPLRSNGAISAWIRPPEASARRRRQNGSS